MNTYLVKITIEQTVEAPDEDIAQENAICNFEYGDLSYADFDIKELERKIKVSRGAK